MKTFEISFIDYDKEKSSVTVTTGDDAHVGELMKGAVAAHDKERGKFHKVTGIKELCDWSQAPKNATHYSPDGGLWPWRSKSGDKWFRFKFGEWLFLRDFEDEKRYISRP
jgi:hypothetical protein